MPAKNGRGTHEDNRITPIKESGKQRKTDTSLRIHFSLTDAPLHTLGKLPAKNQIFGTD